VDPKAKARADARRANCSKEDQSSRKKKKRLHVCKAK